MMQLTDWHTNPTPKVHSTQLQQLFPHFLNLDYMRTGDAHVLVDFLRDKSRSGKYAVTAETYADASVSCLKYLCRTRLGPPINLHHTPRNLARRRNYPWHWNRYKKLIRRLPKVYGKSGRIAALPNRQVDHADYLQAYSKCENLLEQIKRHDIYMGATRLGLGFLCDSLALSAPSERLISLLRADNSFSQRAVLFPGKLKKCKAAIASYLARVQVKTKTSASENDAETTLESDHLELLPIGQEAVLVHDRDLGYAERWWGWMTRGETNGVGEQGYGRWGSWGHVLKFFLPISFCSFFLAMFLIFLLGHK